MSNTLEDVQVCYLHCRILLGMFGDFFVGRADASLRSFEGLKSVPHGPLEDLLHLLRVLCSVKVVAAVCGTVLDGNQIDYDGNPLDET